MKFCMIVDDAEVIRRVGRRIIETSRMIPLDAEDATSALELCRRNMPDAILVDWQMPLTDGAELIEEIRAMEDGDLPKIFYCCSESDPKDIRRALNAGANDYILKPFDKQSVQLAFAENGLSAS